MFRVFTLLALIMFSFIAPNYAFASGHLIGIFLNDLAEERRKRRELDEKHEMERLEAIKDFNLFGPEVLDKIKRRVYTKNGRDNIQGTHIAEAIYLSSGRDVINGGSGWHIYVVDDLETHRTVYVDETTIYESVKGQEIGIYFSSGGVNDYLFSGDELSYAEISSKDGFKIKLPSWMDVDYKLFFAGEDSPYDLREIVEGIK